MSVRFLSWAFTISTGNPITKLVLIKLADSANDDGYCWPSLERIAEETEMTRRSVITHIQKLEAMGLLTVVRRKGEGGANLPNHYQLHREGVVKDVHHSGEGDSPPLVKDVHQGSEGRSPEPSINRQEINTTPPTPPRPASRRDDGLRLSEEPPPPASQPSQETLEHLAKFAAVPMRILSAIGPEKLEDWGRGYTKEEISAAWEQAKSGATKSHRAYFEAILDGKTAFDPEILARHTGRKHVASPEELPPEQHPARLAAQQWRVGDLVSYQGQPKRVVRIDDIWLDLEDGTYVQAYLARRWTGEPAVA